MGTLLVVGLVIAVAAALITPPDLISQIFAMLVMVAVCGLLLFIVSRFKSFAETPERMKTVIAVLVCLLSIAVMCAATFFTAYRRASIRYHELLYEQSEPVASADQPEGVE
jgi:tellurite resistance protein TehA-like permease